MIAIMGAMQEEVALIRDNLTNVTSQSIAKRTFYIGKLLGKDCVVVFSNWGKVAASITATLLITQFKVEKLLFTGLAGAVDTSLNIGDVVIGDKLYQHDIDASPIFPKFHVPLSKDGLFYSDKTLVKDAETVLGSIFRHLSETIPPKTLNQFSITEPKAIVGTIASGDQFISDPDCYQNLAYNDEIPSAVEMEGAAVAQVCEDLDVPYIVIRTISDNANRQSKINFNAFIKQVASIYGYHIVKQLI